MNERIQKILASRGIGSRRACEDMMQQGRVTCNGRICSVGDRADPEIDLIMLDGKKLPSKPAHLYIMLNKPRGFVTTLSDEKGRKNVSELVSDCGQRVYPVGRLDMDSEGLLILTNDGDFANRLMHPRHEIDKKYYVIVDGFSQAGLERLRQPIMLDGYMIRTPEVELLNSNGSTAELFVTIHEGRNRQVRRMCLAAGMRVVRLRRISEGNVMLGKLPVGKWRNLTEKEIQSFI